MFKKSKGCVAAVLMLNAALAGAAQAQQAAGNAQQTAAPGSPIKQITSNGTVRSVEVGQAQDTSGGVHRVEVTGPSIKRIASDGALPIQTITTAETKK